ncbi:deoxyhypusine synthase [Hyaloraphidium curvatum]|nr:deoxyhypusine synthase [Hyaloraphidium curvatum]
MPGAGAPSAAHDAVFVASTPLPPGAVAVRGADFSRPPDLAALLDAYLSTGFQATALALAIAEINAMLRWRLSDEPIADDEAEEAREPEFRARTKCTIFLGYTSNLVSSGLRESFRFIAQHRLVSCIVTTAGGVEEDLIKCLAPTYLLPSPGSGAAPSAAWDVPGADLRARGLNRIGNLVVPNSNYGLFEDWVMPILDAMLEEQKRDGVLWSPSRIIHRLGKEIADERSVYHWCYRNDIPVFCPALTDGSLGDMIYFHSFRNPGLVVDIASDIRRINEMAVWSKRTGAIVLGGGVVKHHILNANLMRNGTDHAVYVNTAQEFDGSDAGARPDEAVSWGKIRAVAKPVKVCADATLVWPLMVAGSFAKAVHGEGAGVELAEAAAGGGPKE